MQGDRARRLIFYNDDNDLRRGCLFLRFFRVPRCLWLLRFSRLFRLFRLFRFFWFERYEGLIRAVRRAAVSRGQFRFDLWFWLRGGHDFRAGDRRRWDSSFRLWRWLEFGTWDSGAWHGGIRCRLSLGLRGQ